MDWARMYEEAKLNGHLAGLQAVRNAALEAAAKKLDHYAAGLAAMGGRGSTAMAAAKMVRDLKVIFERVSLERSDGDPNG